MDQSRGGTTTAGVLVWTPAPAYSSPSSPDGSDYSLDEKPDEDFQRQMDENGIIGLAESQRQLEVDQEVDEEIAEDLLWDVKSPEPEDGPLPALEEMSYHLSELLDSEPLSQTNGDDSFFQEEQDNDRSVGLEDWTDDEDGTENITIHKQELNSFPERDRALDMTDEETEEKNTCEDAQRHMNHSFPENCNNIPTLEITEHSKPSDFVEFKKNKGRFLPASHLSCANTPNPSFFPHLSSEELMNNCGIEAETFPELALTDSRVKSSLSGHQSPTPKTYHTVSCSGEELKYEVTPQTSARSPVMNIRLEKSNKDGRSGDKLDRKLHSSAHNCQSPMPSTRKTNCGSLEDCEVSSPAQLKASIIPSKFSPPPTLYRSLAQKSQRASKTSYTDPGDIRKGQLSHNLPDFSKVEPRVRFPKSGYKPPKSRRAARGKTSHLPVVFKSPAEIVKEVLLRNTDVSPGSPSSCGSHERLKSTVPEEFRCPQQASTLVQQLQEDYNRLLTKYAEAENTIDRLRLEAKVGLFSDPPKPSTAILSGVIQEGLKVMTLSFPQAQRAEFGAGSAQLTQNNSEISRKPSSRPSSVDSGSSRRLGSMTSDHLIETLTKQTHRFQLQVNAFEKLLKNGKLKPCEQIKGVSMLAEGQESLERAYLDARSQYQILQQRQGGPVHFDPDRELEDQIFRSGMHLEELREWVKQLEQNRSISECPLTLTPHTDILSESMHEAELLPESPLSAVHPQACMGVEVSSVSGESDVDREEDEILPSLLHPLYDKHQCVEKDFSNLMDCYQSFKELPSLLDRSVPLTSHDSLDFGDSPSPRNETAVDRQRLRSTNERETTITALLQPAADCVPPSVPSVRSQVCDSMETRSDALCHPSLLPGQPGRERKMVGNRNTHSSSLTSLAESTEPGNKGLKVKQKAARPSPLDGVVSPETDSGFMGSESTQLTPAVHNPLQQRAVVSSIKPPGPHMKNKVRPESTPPSGQSSGISPSRSHPFLVPPVEQFRASGGRTDPVKRRGREESCSATSLSTSISPLHWPDCTLQPLASSLTSQSEHSSDQVHSLSGEKAWNSCYTQPANQQLSSHRIPSLHVPYHHGNHLKAQSSVQLTNHQEALQLLQQEMNILKERLEGSPRHSNLSSPIRVSPSATEDIRDHTHPLTSTPQWHGLRHLEKSVISKHKERGRNIEKEKKERESTPRPAVRQRSSLPRYRPKTDLTAADSEHTHSEPRSLILRHIPVSPIKSSRGRRQTRAGFGHLLEDSTRQQAGSSAGRSDESDEKESSRGPEPACPHCLSAHTAASTRPMRSRSSPRLTQSYCSHCPLCGALQPSQTRAQQPANQDPVSIPTRNQPLRSQQRDRISVNMAVAPPPTVLGGVPVVPYVPVYPSTLYFSSPAATQAYLQPFNISMSHSRDERSGDRGHRRRSFSMDHQQRSLSSSLNRALTEARNMRRVSNHMAHSLASGLQNTSFLTTSCIY